MIQLVRKRELLTSLSGVFCILVLISACGDSSGAPGTQKGVKAKNPQSAKAKILVTNVKKNNLEMGVASEIFAAQAKRKATDVEAVFKAYRVGAKNLSLLDRLLPVFQKESLTLIDLDPAKLRSVVEVHKSGSQKGKSETLSIRLKGRDSTRRVLLVSGAMPRTRSWGPGSGAMEISAALEMMRVLISRRIVGEESPLPFDLEYVLLGSPSPKLSFVQRHVGNNVLVLGVICLEEMTPSIPGSTNLVLQVVPDSFSTIESALVGATENYAGNRHGWSSASLSASLDPVPQKSMANLPQNFLPHVVVRASTSSSDRLLLPSEGAKTSTRAKKEIDPSHELVATKDDSLKNVCDKKYKTVVAIARALAIAVTRLRGAFP